MPNPVSIWLHFHDPLLQAQPKILGNCEHLHALLRRHSRQESAVLHPTTPNSTQFSKPANTTALTLLSNNAKCSRPPAIRKHQRLHLHLQVSETHRFQSLKSLLCFPRRSTKHPPTNLPSHSPSTTHENHPSFNPHKSHDHRRPPPQSPHPAISDHIQDYLRDASLPPTPNLNTPHAQPPAIPKSPSTSLLLLPRTSPSHHHQPNLPTNISFISTASLFLPFPSLIPHPERQALLLLELRRDRISTNPTTPAKSSNPSLGHQTLTLSTNNGNNPKLGGPKPEPEPEFKPRTHSPAAAPTTTTFTIRSVSPS
ncbi:hypothetical protein M758_UG272900 [Ceratodon purpureus]|nr:hypothetical protein M758_UG272900 [Ceratodon purpureus]